MSDGEGFFASRWVERPDHVRETRGLPIAFRAGGLGRSVGLEGQAAVVQVEYLGELVGGDVHGAAPE